MDTRVLKNIEKKEDTAQYLKKIEEEDSDIIIQEDEIENNKKFMESLIFNLAQKQGLKNHLEQQYSQQLSEVKTYPDKAKYYIHIPYILPIVACTIGYLKYKKKLHMNNGMLIICGATAANEFARYKRVMGMDKEKAELYQEHSDNYKYLLRKYTNSISGFKIFSNIFGIDLKKSNSAVSETYYDDDINSEFLTFNYA
ncbi:hypothetical protein PPERSA_10477 [Pseudocohnilembus persalinus]|uniref:Uncharacterized protein n=1 Tax=Pseudocohnilembus persalinus TaxID=266149 RepID=A0A0V0R7S1_PSEPJ|nr:hypothetical protein PPERSA_10477 [Pseudocohnilembus persalinus]|eukprot:KRX10378.1 hypothetical protein PPERSA_10477 [Pseudocohnilembus persalinus]